MKKNKIIDVLSSIKMTKTHLKEIDIVKRQKELKKRILTDSPKVKIKSYLGK